MDRWLMIERKVTGCRRNGHVDGGSTVGLDMWSEGREQGRRRVGGGLPVEE